MTEPTEDLYRMIKETRDDRTHRHINVQGDSVAILEAHCNNSTGLTGDIPATGTIEMKSCEKCSSADEALTRAKQIHDESIAEGFKDLDPTQVVADGLVDKKIRNPEPDVTIYTNGFGTPAGVNDMDEMLKDI